MKDLKKKINQLLRVALIPSSPILWCLIVIGSIPQASEAQTQPLKYGSLQTWDENLWLLFLDRNDSFQGRFSDKGTLKRFTPLVDSKYQLDVLGSQFNPIEDSYWNSRNNGVRWRGTSATTLTLTSSAEFKTSVDLGGPWEMSALFNQVTDRGFEGSSIRLQFSRKLSQSGRIFSGIHLDPHKAGGDFWIGNDWESGPNRVTTQLAVLDPLNDFLHVTLDASLHPHGDTTVVYTQQPIALRLADHLRLSKDFRIEIYGMLMPNSQSIISRKHQKAEEFTLRESARSLGGLVEWKPSEHFLLAGSITEVNANSDRTMTNDLATHSNYQLHENTRAITGFAIFRPTNNWTFSLIGVKKLLSEKRSLSSDLISDKNYLLKVRMSKFDVAYSTSNGFVTKTGLLYSNSETPRGDGGMHVTNSLAGNFYRFLLNFGWEFNNSSIFLGGAYDYTSHAIHPGWIWGTVSGRFSMYW